MPVSLSDPAARRRYVVLLASLLFMFVGTGSVYFVVIALKPIAAEFDWPRAVPSIAYALQYGGAGVGGIFMGWILDRRGLGIPAFTGGAMIGSGAILTAYISSPWEFYFVHGVMLGFFGRSTLFAPLTANITRWFENSKSIAVGIIGSGQGIAGMVWPQTFHYLIEAVGWRQAALYYGLFALATLLPLATILRWQPPLAGPVAPPVHPADPHAAIQPVAPPSPPRPVLTPLSIQLTLCIAAIGCCVAMARPLAHIVSYVSDLGYDRARGAEV
ncbi:MAG: MFS transporter, partial [Alphaproteobacteria bacterium]